MKNIGEKSLFLVDDRESNVDEAVVDYFLSWTLRCASPKNINKHSLVNEYSKVILEVLLGTELQDITSVKTWKQSKKIDLWVEIETAESKHALLIETKVYSHLRTNQLEGYKKTFENYYKGEDFQKHYCLITCHEPIPEEDLEKCKKARDFRAFSISGIYDELSEKYSGNLELTGSDLFDEFWHGTGWC